MQRLETKADRFDDNTIITNHINYSQSTHKEFLSRSAGMAMLKLRENYIGVKGLNDEENQKIDDYINKEYKSCKQELKKLAAESKDAKLVTTIDLLIEKAEEPVIPDYDKLNLYLPKNNESKDIQCEFEDKSFTFPLREVVTLLWKALLDNDKFYKDENTSTTTQTKTDLQLRLDSFGICVKEKMFWYDENLRQWISVCHTGIRNELLQQLNKTYKDIDICIDSDATVLSVLKDNVANKLWKKLAPPPLSDDQKTLDPASKKAFMLGLYSWMMESKADKLASVLDPEKNMLQSLKEFFVRHGSKPAQIETTYMEALQHLRFTFDNTRDPLIISSLATILQAHETKPGDRGNSLTGMKKWILKHFDLENEIHKSRIENFAILYRCHKYLEDYDYILQLMGKKEEYQAFGLECIDYLQRLAKMDDAEIPAELLGKAGQFLTCIEQVKNETLQPEIENYFARWNAAQKSNNLPAMKHIYSLLLDHKTSSKILCDDKTIDRFHVVTDQEKKEGFRNITPYIVNRIFLHAIMVDPYDWTKKFAAEFERILRFVEGNFTEPVEGNLSEAAIGWRASNLKRDSYTPLLLRCLNHLLNKRNGVPEEKNARPYAGYGDLPDLFYLPEHIKDSYEWLRIREILPDEYRNMFYQAYSIKIHSYFVSSFLSGSYNNNFQNLPRVIDNIPDDQLRAFFKFYGTEKFINDFTLRFFINNFDIVSKGLRQELLLELSSESLRSIVQAFSNLMSIVRFIDDDKRLPLLERLLKPTLAEVFNKNPYCCMEFLNILPEDQLRWFLQQLPDDYLLNQFSIYEFQHVFRTISIEKQRIILARLGHDYLSKLFKSSYDFIDMFRRLNPATRQLVIHFLGDEHIKTCLANIEDLQTIIAGISEHSFEDFFVLCREQIKNLIKDSKDLSSLVDACLVGCYDAKNRIEIILNSLGHSKLREMIQTHEGNIRLIFILITKFGIEFLERLGVEHTRQIIKNGSILKSILDNLPEENHRVLLQFLGDDHLTKIMDRNIRDTVLGTWEEKQRDRYLDELKPSEAQTLWPTAQDLGDTLASLPSSYRCKFVSRLGDRFIKIIAEDKQSDFPLLSLFVSLAKQKGKSLDQLISIIDTIGEKKLRDLLTQNGKYIDYKKIVKLIKKQLASLDSKDSSLCLHKTLLYALTLAYISERKALPTHTKPFGLGAEKLDKLNAAYILLVSMKNDSFVFPDIKELNNGNLGCITQAYKEIAKDCLDVAIKSIVAKDYQPPTLPLTGKLYKDSYEHKPIDIYTTIFEQLRPSRMGIFSESKHESRSGVFDILEEESRTGVIDDMKEESRRPSGYWIS